MILVEDCAALTVAIADCGAELERQLTRYEAYSSRFAGVQGQVERAHASGSSAENQLALLHRLARELARIERDLVIAAGRLHAAVRASACDG